MTHESVQPEEQYEKDTHVEAYGFEWLVSEVDHKGRYTLVFENWTLYAVNPILVSKKRDQT